MLPCFVSTLSFSCVRPVFRGLPANIQLDVDGDRETERIYSLFSTYMTKLIKMQGQALTRVFASLRACHCIFHSVLSVFIFTVSRSAVCLPPAEACGSKSVYDGPEQEEYSSFVIDDPQETYKTLKLIVSAVQTLEQQHTKYKRDKFKKTKIGSQYVVCCLFMLVKLHLLCIYNETEAENCGKMLGGKM